MLGKYSKNWDGNNTGHPANSIAIHFYDGEKMLERENCASIHRDFINQQINTSMSRNNFNYNFPRTF